jgi:hypothetical protein
MWGLAYGEIGAADSIQEGHSHEQEQWDDDDLAQAYYVRGLFLRAVDPRLMH